MNRLLLLLLAMVTVAPVAKAQTMDVILDDIQSSAFQYFWFEANPANGLIKDRSASGAPCSVASTGFGLTAICIAADHGWVSRAAAADRVLITLQTFWNGPQGSAASGMIGYKGFFYHFLDMNTATRTWDSELSPIDTALLLAGILDCKQYFNGPDATEGQIRALADSIYRRVDWPFMQNFNPGILLAWKPGTGFAGYGQWIGYNEAMIMYLLALGSPTHPVASSAWTTWTSGYWWSSQYGYTYVIFPPLFGHQYSHVWIDFRNIQDPYMLGKGIDYFENSRRATLAQRAYSIANPGGYAGYSDSLWGITASDYPGGYLARGAPPAQNDEGTITPTAAISSIAFAPDQVIPVVRNMYTNYLPQLWTVYGFRDAFNPTVGWYASDVIGIDQGPIIAMIENYRTEAVWNRFMKNSDILRGLQRAGFVGLPTAVDPPLERPRSFELYWSEPNPFSRATTIRFRMGQAGRARLTVYDIAGREVERLVDDELPAGLHHAEFRAAGLPSGVYHYRLESNGRVTWKPVVLLK